MFDPGIGARGTLSLLALLAQDVAALAAVQVLGVRCWVLGARCWVLGARCWVLGMGRFALIRVLSHNGRGAFVGMTGGC